MTRPQVVAAMFLLAVPAVVFADGFLMKAGGKLVPEEEQKAYIEWADGKETLYVATRAGAAADAPVLWIIPLPGDPKKVDAEPVAGFRHVVHEESVVARAERTLQEGKAMALTLDTALCPLIAISALGTNASRTFNTVGSALPGVEVHKHIEKMGMVVEVLSSKSAEALDAYLADKKLEVRAAEISALEPYLREEHALICAWPKEGKESMTARGLKIDFPTAKVFYPLRPSRVYTNTIKTSIYVRGWFHPTPDLNLPGLKCGYVWAKVTDEPITDAFAALRSGSLPYETVAATRVDLSSTPSGWTQDLTMDPGEPKSVSAAVSITEMGQYGMWYGLICLGAILSVYLPLAVVVRTERRWYDWLWALAVGAGLGLSVLFSGLVFLFWMERRQRADLATGSEAAGKHIAAIGLVLVSTLAFLTWLSIDRPNNLAPILAITTMVPAIGLVLYGLSRPARRPVAFGIFVGLHLVVSYGVLTGLEMWIAPYK